MQLRRVIEKLLGATGWSLRRTTGSHNIFGKEGRAPIVVSFHGSQVETPTRKTVDIEIMGGFSQQTDSDA